MNNKIDKSKVKYILFDIDGTLCSMDNDIFTNAYFKELVIKLMPHGYEKDSLVNAIWTGTKAMVMNDGSKTNYDAFWAKFADILGSKVYDDESVFNDFYANEFNNVRNILDENPLIPKFVNKCKENGYRMIIASNPLFPMIAQKSRLEWATLNPEDFEYITSYENSHYCKPNPLYFKEIAEKHGLNPEECLVIGNDATEDGAALKIGMQLFIVTDYLINKENKDMNDFAHGTWEDIYNILFNN